MKRMFGGKKVALKNLENQVRTSYDQEDILSRT